MNTREQLIVIVTRKVAVFSPDEARRKATAIVDALFDENGAPLGMEEYGSYVTAGPIKGALISDSNRYQPTAPLFRWKTES